MTMLRRFALTGVAVTACALLLAGTAYGHASLVGSTPQRGAELQRQPAAVVFEFSEPVEASFGAVTLFDPQGNEIGTGEPFRPGGDESRLAVSLPSGLTDGLYTATFRVISADAHPVSGGIVFSIGEGGPGSGKTISQLLAGSEAGPVTDSAFWLVRWIGYLAIAAAVGVLAFLMLLWGPIQRSDGSAARFLSGHSAAAAVSSRKVLTASIVAGLIASALAIPLQGAVASGGDFWSALDPTLIGEVVDTRFGGVVSIRMIAWLLLVPLVLGMVGAFTARQPLGSARVIAALVGVGFLLVSPGLAGHAATADPVLLVLPSDVIHVAAMAFWTGTLFALLVVLPSVTRQLTGDRERSEVLTAFIMRFSSLALIAVALVAVSGSVQAVVQLDALPELWQTAYGQALAVKICLFLILVAFGAVNRKKWVPALVARRERGLGPGAPGLSIKKNLRLEVGLAVVVLAATAVLVGETPPAAVSGGPVSGTASVGSERLDYTLEPALPGSNEMHLYVFDDRNGAPLDVDSLEVNFALPDSGIPPLEFAASRAGPGHFVVTSAMLPVRGEWTATVSVRFSRFEEQLVEVRLGIG